MPVDDLKLSEKLAHEECLRSAHMDNRHNWPDLGDKRDQPMTIFDPTGRLTCLNTLRDILCDIFAPPKLPAHRALHKRALHFMNSNERHRLVVMLNQILHYPNDTLSCAYNCMRMGNDQDRFLINGQQMRIPTMLHWLCTTIDDDALHKNHALPVAPRGSYHAQIVTRCGTPECVNPQHYSQRLYGNMNAEDAKRYVTDMLASRYGVKPSVFENPVEMNSGRYTGGKRREWISYERAIARNSEPLGSFEYVLFQNRFKEMTQPISEDDIVSVDGHHIAGADLPDFVRQYARPLISTCSRMRIIPRAESEARRRRARTRNTDSTATSRRSGKKMSYKTQHMLTPGKPLYLQIDSLPFINSNLPPMYPYQMPEPSGICGPKARRRAYIKALNTPGNYLSAMPLPANDTNSSDSRSDWIDRELKI